MGQIIFRNRQTRIMDLQYDAAMLVQGNSDGAVRSGIFTGIVQQNMDQLLKLCAVAAYFEIRGDCRGERNIFFKALSQQMVDF